MNFIFNDGGRKEAGYKGPAGDCAARAMAIALNIPYKTAYCELAKVNKDHGEAKSARNGVHNYIYSDVLKLHGWFWNPAPKFIGRGATCKDMPMGTVIARQAEHNVTVVNGIPQDTWDSSEKMVFGFWAKK